MSRAIVSPHTSVALVQRWWDGLDKPAWRMFWFGTGGLAVALGLAIYSGAAFETGHPWIGEGAAILALALALWVGVKVVPPLARRTPLRWLAYHIDYKMTREGVIYISGVLLIALAALNTGNNLLFMILSALIAGILISGILSSVVLTGVEMKMEVPEHIFAEQPVLASVELANEKLSLPSFSLRVEGETKKGEGQILTRPVYFPFLGRRQAASQRVELIFPRRGAYRQDAFGIRTRFPFGFLQKTRRVDSPMELVVYPRVQPTEEFYEILPLVSGELESFYRGRGHDLYSIRDYLATDGARFVDWKASAKSGELKVREFAREDERRVMLVFDPYLPPGQDFSSPGGQKAAEQFERGVSLCACLAWHFHELDSEMEFRMHQQVRPMAPAGEIIYDVLRALAFVQPATDRTDGQFLRDLTARPDTFKIILTGQPRGSIPTSLWSSSYIVFVQSLQGQGGTR